MLTSNFRSTPDSTPGAISISRFAPRYKRYKSYRPLAPGAWYKTAPIDEYIPLYMDILSKLNPQYVYDDLCQLADGAEPILLCYEQPNEFCHRRLVSNWLESALGISIPEGKYKDGIITTVEPWESRIKPSPTAQSQPVQQLSLF